MNKVRLIFYRVLQLIPVLVGISIVTFLLARAMEGDPMRLILGPRASESAIAAARARYGLDEPVFIQYGIYLGNLVQGDWGESIAFKTPVLTLLRNRIEPTLYLLAGGMICSIVPAVLLAVLAARRPDSWLDHLIRWTYIVALGLPAFWFAIVLSLVFSRKLGWFPVTGFGQTFLEHVHHIFLPSITIGIAMFPILVRNLRSTLLEKQEADFVAAGRSKGLPERYIFTRHTFPNSVLPSLHLLGLVAVYIFGISVIIEPIFGIAGLGQLFLASIIGRDYFVIQGLTLVFALVTVISSLVVDVLTFVIDPRVEA